MTTMSWVTKLGDWLSGSSCGRSKLPSIRFIKPSQWLSIQWGPCLGLFVHFTQGLSVKTMIELQNDLRLKKLMRPANWNMRPSTIPPPVARNFNSLWSYFTFPRTILQFSSNIQQWCTSWVLTTCMIAQSDFSLLHELRKYFKLLKPVVSKSRLPSLPLPNVTWNA